MSWLSNLTPPGIKNIFRREDEGADQLWTKCDNCGEMIFHRDLEAALHVCPSCGHHMKIDAEERLKALFDDGEWQEIEAPEPPHDPLKFRDERRYTDRLRDARRKTGQVDAMRVAAGTIESQPAVVALQNFQFMGGSMGVGLGEALLKAVETAIERRAGLIAVTASGGARMQEGILSLMQMPRTTVAIQMLHEAGLPFIVILAHPTTGGVTASFAMLGDVHIAEPGALIGFAGPRVIEQTIREKLPPEFQRAEFLLEKGMVDMVTPRGRQREALGRLLRTLTAAAAARAAAPGAGDPAAPEAANDPATPPAEAAPALDKAAE